MWSPTHVQVIVQSAENLLIKGKNDTNNAFVVIELEKESYRTSIKEKSEKSVTWNEECELKIPKKGNKASIILTAYHRNNLGLDQFLGTVKIPLASFENLQRSVQRYKLEGKPGKEKKNDKVRGELVLEISFMSKLQTQSLTSLQSKEKSSFNKLTGSLFGLSYSGGKKGVKKFTNTLSRVVLLKGKKEGKSPEKLDKNDNQINNIKPLNKYDNLDPGVVSDDEDNTSHKSSESLGDVLECQAQMTMPPPKPQRTFLKNPQISVSHWEEGGKTKSSSFLNISVDNLSTTGSRAPSPNLEDRQRRLSDRRLSSSCVDFSHLTTPKPEKKFSSSLNLEKSQENKRLSKLAKKLKSFHSVDKLSKKDNRRSVAGCEDGDKYHENLAFPKSEIKNKNKDELVNMVVDLQKRVNCISHRVKDLEDYLDHILVKVMDTVPKLLEKS